MELGERAYREIWFFADLRGGNEHLGSRSHEEPDVWVNGFVIAHQRRRTRGVPLVELDADGNVIDDWFELTLDEAKNHGATRTHAEDEGLNWEPIPETDDVRAYIRKRLNAPKPPAQ